MIKSGILLSSFYIYDDLLEEFYFEFYYDFAYDADYPDRDWFVTVIFGAGVRKDFATFEQAEIFIKNTLGFIFK